MSKGSFHWLIDCFHWSLNLTIARASHHVCLHPRLPIRWMDVLLGAFQVCRSFACNQLPTLLGQVHTGVARCEQPMCPQMHTKQLHAPWAYPGNTPSGSESKKKKKNEKKHWVLEKIFLLNRIAGKFSFKPNTPATLRHTNRASFHHCQKQPNVAFPRQEHIHSGILAATTNNQPTNQSINQS
jgi:hypothetical protein